MSAIRMTPVRISSIRGSQDGIRWGRGVRPQAHGGAAMFSWSYDMLNDVFRIWSITTTAGGNAREIRNPPYKAEAYQRLREALGLNEKSAVDGVTADGAGNRCASGNDAQRYSMSSRSMAA